MSSEKDQDSAPPPPPASLARERVALSLLRRAGRRAAPPPDINDRLYATMLEVWTDQVDRHRRKVRRLAAVAGFALLVLGLGLWAWRQSAAAVSIASITRLSAAVTVEREGDLQRISSAFRLMSGDRIEVPVGGSLAARRPDGTSVRVAGPASLVWEGPNRIHLERGRVYVDMGARSDPEGPTFEVHTPFARIEHGGTRFTAESGPSHVRVAVRDGAVRMTSANGVAFGLRRGQAAEAGASGEMAWVAPPVRTDWEWVEALAPPCAVEGRVLLDVLRDLAREADLELAFASPAVERRARALMLHGPAIELLPRPAIDAVLEATDLDADLSGQRVVLRERVISSS
ncbi:MAG: FecR family protein [Gammaproteobacteria bacterium]